MIFWIPFVLFVWLGRKQYGNDLEVAVYSFAMAFLIAGVWYS